MDKPGFDVHADIPGTTVFDGRMAMKGYALNKMCYSFNDQSARDAFAADEEGYMTHFALTDEQKAAVCARDILAMIEAGGNIYYLAKLAGIFKLSVQDVGGMQTGMTTEEFKLHLKSQA